MKKHKAILVGFLFVIGIFSISISTATFFFTTKYYSSPLIAYNETAGYNAIYGETVACNQLGLFLLDNETCLFLGELDENRFVVNEMYIKDKKYASNGSSVFYDLRESSDGLNRNSTQTASGCVEWSIAYTQEEINTLINILSIKTYTLTSGCEVHLVIYKE